MKFTALVIDAVKTRNFSKLPPKLRSKIFQVCFDPFKENLSLIILPEPSSNKSNDDNLKCFVNTVIKYNTNKLKSEEVNEILQKLELSKNEVNLYKKLLSGKIEIPKKEIEDLAPDLFIYPKKFMNPINFDSNFSLTFPLVAEPFLNGIKIRFHVNNQRGVAYSEDFCTFNNKFKSIIDKLVNICQQKKCKDFFIDAVIHDKYINEHQIYRNTDFDILHFGTDEKPIHLHAIDYFDGENFSFIKRRKSLEKIVKHLNNSGEKITVVPQVIVNDFDEAWKGFQGDKERFDFALRSYNSIYEESGSSNYVLLSKNPVEFVKLDQIIKGKRGTIVAVVVSGNNKEIVLTKVPQTLADSDVGKTIEIVKIENNYSFLKFRRDK